MWNKFVKNNTFTDKKTPEHSSSSTEVCPSRKKANNMNERHSASSSPNAVFSISWVSIAVFLSLTQNWMQTQCAPRSHPKHNATCESNTSSSFTFLLAFEER